MNLLPAWVGAAVFLPMLIEARVSRVHERWLLAHGAIEPRGDVYPLMQVAYPGAFLAMLAEAALRAIHADTAFAAGAAVFMAAKALKYWAVATLGNRWTFRVLVPPDSARVTTGPYRALNHPNYVAVAGELAGAAIALHALITGPVAVVAFILIMRARVHIEERALGTR